MLGYFGLVFLMEDRQEMTQSVVYFYSVWEVLRKYAAAVTFGGCCVESSYHAKMNGMVEDRFSTFARLLLLFVVAWQHLLLCFI